MASVRKTRFPSGGVKKSRCRGGPCGRPGATTRVAPTTRCHSAIFSRLPSPGKASPSAGQAPQGAAEPGRVLAAKPILSPRWGSRESGGFLDPGLAPWAKFFRPFGPLALRASTFRTVQQIRKSALTSTSTSRTLARRVVAGSKSQGVEVPNSTSSRMIRRA